MSPAVAPPAPVSTPPGAAPPGSGPPEAQAQSGPPFGTILNSARTAAAEGQGETGTKPGTPQTKPNSKGDDALAAAIAVLTGQTPAAACLHAGAAPAGAAPAPGRLQLVLPLATDVRGLTRFADAVSTPGSPRYGHYASVSWLARRFGARPAVRRRVISYLRRHGASDVRVDATGQLVEAAVGVASAERMFATTLAPTPGPRAARALSPRSAAVLPRPLRGLVTGVVGLNTAPLGREVLPPSSGYQGPDPGATPSGCAAGAGEGGFTPNEYLSAYQYTPLQQQGLLGQGERVALIEIDGFRTSDLTTFASCFRLHSPPVKAIPVGVPRPLPAGGEATLDLEVLDSAAPDLKEVDVYETSANAADVLSALSEPLQSPGFKPQVISVSLGLCEGNALETVGQPGIGAIETVLKLASAAGVSVLGASGDMGSADCAQSGKPVPSLAVNFPSSSPWVTSVGGTNFDLGPQNQILSQTVWNDGSAVPGNAGGGGASELFGRPSWQNGAISSPWRAQPDVAMLADVSPGYAVYCTAPIDCHGRGWLSFGGTSAATPLLAGGFALIDESLRRHGRVALGFANPLLYRLGRSQSSAAQVYYDVASGSNDVGPFIQPSQAPLGCCSARPGYDEASGWGGVDLAALGRAALLAQRPLATATLGLIPDQRAVRGDGLYVTVGCTAACDVAAFARVSARGMRTFNDYAFAHLIQRNHRRMKVVFSPAQEEKLRTALAAHRRIVAHVFAAIVDSAGNIERRTSTLTVQVSG